MALTQTLPPDRRFQPSAELARKGRKWLATMENQKAMAREMIDTARLMCDRAEEMRRPPRLVVP